MMTPKARTAYLSDGERILELAKQGPVVGTVKLVGPKKYGSPGAGWHAIDFVLAEYPGCSLRLSGFARGEQRPIIPEAGTRVSVRLNKAGYVIGIAVLEGGEG